MNAIEAPRASTALVRIGEASDGAVVTLNLERVVHTFIAGSTRSGKSNTMRVVLERARGPILPNGGVVHQAIIDPEGEFAATLTQLGDYIVFSADGPHRIDAETAPRLAETFVELGFNLIADLSDVSRDEQHAWVAAFCGALARIKVERSPRAHGRRALVVIDEVQIYCPELNKQVKGMEYPAASEITALVSTGAKRHVHVIAGSQRMKKVRADLRGECSTLLIGKHNRDDDRETAADELGTGRKARAGVVEQIAALTQGWFYARGDGVSDTLVLVHVDKAKTDPPQDLKAIVRAPMPTSQAARLVAEQLKDFEQEAKQEVHDLEEAKMRIATLETELAETRERGSTMSEREFRERLQAAERAVEARFRELIREAEDHVNAAWATWADYVLESVESACEDLQRAGTKLSFRQRPDVHTTGLGDNTPDGPPRKSFIMPPEEKVEALEAETRVLTRHVDRVEKAKRDADASGITTPQQRILDALAELAPVGFPRPSVDMLAGYVGVSPTSGGYKNNLGALRSAGLLEPAAGDGTAQLTAEGRKKARPRATPMTRKDLRERVRGVLSAPENAILDAVLAVYPRSLTKDELAACVNVSSTSGGYKNNLGHMRTLGLIDYPEPGTVRAEDWLLLKGGAR